ncbi:hypothetical protein D6D15_02161 [Aureobasidium pullulans]|uniref:Uncharacterized protein n=1 Tax=Aureobasidium pullulans TaxID=5580 RepID=A0A4S9BK68_AURPU|nr:hypothetical protein D6D15_02161 [Aureobasidium pullulans]
MTDLPTLIKQSKDIERKIKKIKTRNANRDLVEKRKALEVQIDQQTEKLNDINGNIESSQKQMLDVCDGLGEAARQVKRLSKYDRWDLEVVLKLLDEKDEKISFTEFKKLRRARKQVMEMEKMLDDFNKKVQKYRSLTPSNGWILHLLAETIFLQSQDKFGWQVDLPPTFENDQAVEIFQTKMAEKLEDMRKAKKQSHQLS